VLLLPNKTAKAFFTLLLPPMGKLLDPQIQEAELWVRRADRFTMAQSQAGDHADYHNAGPNGIR